MQTIRIPKNLLFLSDKLPKPNYDTKVNNSGELPEIRQINQRKKPKNKDNLEKENLENTSNPTEPQIASIKKKYGKEGVNIEGNNLNKNPNNNNEEEGLGLGIGLPNKIIDKREKSPIG
jgi:hypothetical protein